MANYTLYFKTLSPVSVGTGEKFSPYSDFVIEKNFVHFIDKEKIKAIIRSKPNFDELIDLYVAGIATGMDNNRSHFELKQYITNTLKVPLSEVTLRKHQASPSVKGKILISEIIKNPHFQPYIPGSSLKGACKGALLYDWLKNHSEGKTWLKELLDVLSKNNKDLIKNKTQDLQRAYTNIQVAFADSSCLAREAIHIYKTIRFHIHQAKDKGTPQFVEAIAPENTFQTEFRSKENEPTKVFQALVQLSQDANQRDIEILENARHKSPETEQLLNFYYHIQEKLTDGKICFKIGSGKGYFFQSIGLAVYYQAKEHFGKFLQFFHPASKPIKNHNEFPLTKVVDADDFSPWGWVQVDTKPIAKIPQFVSLEIGLPFELIHESQEKKEQIKQEIRAEYLKTSTKLKKGTMLDAIVVQSGKPNKVKLMIAPNNEPIFDLKGYSSPLEEGKIVIVTIEYNEKKNQILDVIFKKLK
ncbi:type III-A CRISPR-associated RAMP protein Csm5 [Raineya orbicola]|uniref:CRISPR system Cms protein Csm5 n=1 Tax=Raineya orbicola TaxID=2016530 RepID=A0A2N3IBK0_9BACT|nr:type III-A CRISPR-associated RAMP protein Csm5 [Raineya orbicola]PKQ67670.1 CRISPR type III-A/MTUBE-associated RAMP protein Csm5 [Raineya orbicola]